MHQLKIRFWLALSYQGSEEDGLRMGLEQLCYMENSDVLPIPSWVRSFIELGWAISGTNSAGTRVMIGLSVPTRAYVAGLLCAGVVLGRTSQRYEDPEARFRRVSRLRVGTPLLLLKNGKRFKAIFEGVSEVHGRTMLRVRTQDVRGGNLTELVSVEHCHNVIVGDRPVELPKNQSGRRMAGLAGFAEEMFSIITEKGSSLESHLDAIVIGKPGLFGTEVNETGFAVSTSTEDYSKGSLQDVIRVRRFLATKVGYRTDILWNLSDNPEVPQDSVVIFDGADGFLKWRHLLTGNDCLIVLDRTESRFFDAVNEVNTTFLTTRVDQPFPFDLPEMPSGVELTAFEEGLR